MLNKWMKRMIGTAVVGSLLFGGSSVFAASTVFVNGAYQYNSINVEGHTLVKLRALKDPSWLVFAYDPKTHIVMFHTKDNTTKVELREGDKTATVNGKEVNIDTAVVNKDGLTYVPLRFISETLGAYVKYDAKENLVIVRTPFGQAQYETLMHGDLAEARKIALGLAKIRGDAPRPENGELYNYYSYSFPEGEALRYTFSESGYCNQYYEVNEDGVAVLKWQHDDVANRDWGKKPTFKSYVYFNNEFMGGSFTYGIVKADGTSKELDRFHPERSQNLVFPIEGEKRTDARM